MALRGCCKSVSRKWYPTTFAAPPTCILRFGTSSISSRQINRDMLFNILVDHGADMNASDRTPNSLLGLVIGDNMIEIVQRLLMLEMDDQRPDFL